MIEEDKRLLNHASDIESAFDSYFPQSPANGDLIKSMRYTLLAPGKRVRPHLTLEFCRLFGGEEEHAFPYACAVEAMHTYYLIHDDLPCMDNADLRRGRSTNHRVYGEAMAMLSGNALQAFAFYLAATNRFVNAYGNSRACALLAEKVGCRGMCGGQEEDIQNEDRPVGRSDLERINRKKTGSLFQASCILGCIAADATEEQCASADQYALNIGAAYQIIDDLLDVTVSSRDMGKSALTDVKNMKTTFVTLLGKDGARALAEEYTEEAVKAIKGYKNSEYLISFARDMLDRRK